jgi:3-(3-hydroxy-phenyl)propionate hydroxylase
MVNLQQYWLEQYLVERAQQLGALDLRWRHKVTAVSQGAGRAVVDVETVDGTYRLETDWLVVADGARSPIRRMMGLDVEGKVFQDRFLIADIVLDGELFPKDQTERWFWFDPPFHGGQGVHPDQRMPGGTSVLLHREADNVWRIDFQLGWSADPEAEKAPERVIPRVRAALDSQGFRHVGFELEWVSVYTFQCRRMKDFRAGRVLFVGDAAHQVSPFGARGANSGLQDADNLVWKLRLVIDGRAPERLLDTYSDERIAAADENILNSTRATDFITPKSHVSQVMRNAVLTLARQVPCGRALVNSGRLSVPSTLDRSTLNTPDRDRFGGWMVPGAPIDDAPVRAGGRDGWLLAHVVDRFTMLLFAAGGPGAAERAAVAALERDRIPVHTVAVVPAGAAASAGIECVEDVQGLAGQRFDAQPGTAYLLRPDQHVAARWRDLDVAAVRAAVARATCNG